MQTSRDRLYRWFRFRTWCRRRLTIALRFGGRKDRLMYPVIVNSIPKSGTNLLANIVLAVPGAFRKGSVSNAGAELGSAGHLAYLKKQIPNLREGAVYAGHVPYSPEVAFWIRMCGFKHVFIYRDPRDVVVSLCHYIMKEKEPRHPYYNLYRSFGSHDQRLMAAIRGHAAGQHRFRFGSDSVSSIRLTYAAFLGWLDDPNTHCVRFEDLVASGAANNGAIAVVRDLLRYLGLQPDQVSTEDIFAVGRDPAQSQTFRRGKQGAWKDEFTADHLRAFEETGGLQLLDRLGYPRE